MKKDPIVAEVRRAREKIMAKCGYDLKKLGEYLARRRKAREMALVNNRRKRSRDSAKAKR